MLTFLELVGALILLFDMLAMALIVHVLERAAAHRRRSRHA